MAPVFFLLVFGMIEYGRMVMVQQVITNASREGARVGVLDGSTSTDVSTAVSTYLTAARISGATTTCNPTHAKQCRLRTAGDGHRFGSI